MLIFDNTMEKIFNLITILIMILIAPIFYGWNNGANYA